MNKLFLFAGMSSLLFCGAVSAHDEFEDAEEALALPKLSSGDEVAEVAPIVKKEEAVDIRALSETLGNLLGKNLKSADIALDLDAVIKGIREGAAGKPAPMTEQQYQAAMISIQEKALAEAAVRNLKAANEFLAKNAKETGIRELEAGKLQYQILQEGTGAVVLENATPLIHYTGKYIDGTTFGSSDKTSGPITIPLNQTIPGFSKGIAGMKEGEKRRLFIHPDLGYGTHGQLSPNALLIFDIEVIKAQAKPEEKKVSFNETESSEETALNEEAGL